MVREAVLEGDVMAKRAGILVENRFFCPLLEYQLFFKAHVIGGGNNKAFVQRSHLVYSLNPHLPFGYPNSYLGFQS